MFDGQNHVALGGSVISNDLVLNSHVVQENVTVIVDVIDEGQGVNLGQDILIVAIVCYQWP